MIINSKPCTDKWCLWRGFVQLRLNMFLYVYPLLMFCRNGTKSCVCVRMSVEYVIFEVPFWWSFLCGIVNYSHPFFLLWMDAFCVQDILLKQVSAYRGKLPELGLWKQLYILKETWNMRFNWCDEELHTGLQIWRLLNIAVSGLLKFCCKNQETSAFKC